MPAEQGEQWLEVIQALQKQNEQLQTIVQNLAKGQSAPQQSQSSGVHGVQFARYDEKAESFDDYIDRLNAFFDAQNVKVEDKVKNFITMIPPHLFKLLKTLLHPVKYSDKSYEELVELLKLHLNPPPLIIPSRYTFWTRRQGEGESISTFIAELRKLLVPCRYKNEVMKIILRDAFIIGLRDRVILNRLLQEDDIDLDDTTKIALSMEQTAEGVTEMLQKQATSTPTATVTPNTTSVNKVSEKKHNKYQKKFTPRPKPKQSASTDTKGSKSASGQKCFKCGRTNHLSPDCTAKNLHCSYCDRDNHVESVCLSKRRDQKHKQRVSHLEDYDLQSADENVFNVNRISHEEEDDDDADPITVYAQLNDVTVPFELDSGSRKTLLPVNLFKTIPGVSVEKLYATNVAFKGYGGKETIRPIGVTSVNVNYNNVKRRLQLFVVDEKHTAIFGREWMNKLFGKDWPKRLGVNDSHTKARYTTVNSIDIQYELKQKINRLTKRYESIFSPVVGVAKNFQYSVKLKAGAKPVRCHARPVPFALKPKLDKEIDRLVREGQWVPVTSADPAPEWATPIVPVVKGDSVRITGDYSVTLNPYMEIPSHPLPSHEEVFANLKGGKRYSVLDVRSAFSHILVCLLTSWLCTLITHRGLFRPTRLMFGMAASPAVWLEYIELVLMEILAEAGVVVVHDDLIVTGETDEEHLQKLEKVFQLLAANGIHLNLAKCRFFQKSVKFLGYTIDARGIHKTQDKIDAIVNAKTPENQTDVKSFLGLVNFYGRFCPNLSTMAEPLYALSRKDAKFEWSDIHTKSFERIKEELASDRVLVHYDPSLPVVLSVDASPTGIGAVLAHVIDGCERPIAYASKTLNKAERNYSQIDKEALAIVWGIKKFYIYLYGRRFTLYTDHKPLVHIFGPNKRLPVLTATRLLHYAIQLQLFTFDIRYRKSECNGNADALSRLPTRSEELSTEIDFASVFHVQQIDTLPINAKQLARATLSDPELLPIVEKLRTGETLGERDYKLSLHDNIVFHGMRTYIPTKYREQILAELHQGHIGIVKMKALARSYVYWPKIDKDIENLSRGCPGCQSTAREPEKVPVHHWEYPSKPWQRVHVDHAGPFYNHLFLLIIDAYTKWPEIVIVPNTSSAKTVEVLQSIFARFGLPETIVSDNGTAFTGGEFQKFVLQTGIKHRTSSPGHPATNGQAERYVYTLKQAIRAMAKEPGTIQNKLDKLLFAYRRAPHATTGESPAKLMLNRELRSALDQLRPNLKDRLDQRNDSDRTAPMFTEGEKVAVRNYRSPNNKWEFGRIVAADGPRNYTIDVAGKLWRRHTNQIRRIPESTEISTKPTANIPISTKPTANIPLQTIPAKPTVNDTSSPSTSNEDPPRTTPPLSTPPRTSTGPLQKSSMAPLSNSKPPVPPSLTPPQETLRRSTRDRRAPNRLVLKF